jgi:hypothetical protein
MAWGALIGAALFVVPLALIAAALYNFPFDFGPLYVIMGASGAAWGALVMVDAYEPK